MGKGRLLHSFTLLGPSTASLPGTRLGQRGLPTIRLQTFAQRGLHARFSTLKGQPPRHSLHVKSQLGQWPTGGQWAGPKQLLTKVIEGWRLTPAGESVSLLQSLPRGRATLAHFPHTTGGKERRVVTFLLINSHISLHLGHRQPLAPPVHLLPPQRMSLSPASLEAPPRARRIKVKPSRSHALCGILARAPPHALYVPARPNCRLLIHAPRSVPITWGTQPSPPREALTVPQAPEKPTACDWWASPATTLVPTVQLCLGVSEPPDFPSGEWEAGLL